MKTHQNFRPLEGLYHQYLQELQQTLPQAAKIQDTVTNLASGVEKLTGSQISRIEHSTKETSTSVIKIEVGEEAMELHHIQELIGAERRKKKYLLFYKGTLVEQHPLILPEGVPAKIVFLLSMAEHLFLPTTGDPAPSAPFAPAPSDSDAASDTELPLYQAYKTLIQKMREASDDPQKLVNAIDAANEALEVIPGALTEERTWQEPTQQVYLIRITVGDEALEMHQCFLRKGGKLIVKKYHYFRSGTTVDKASFCYTEKLFKKVIALGIRLHTRESGRAA